MADFGGSLSMALRLQSCKSGGNYMSLNKVLVIGNLGVDPEVRHLPSGKPTASFSIAANRRYKLEGQLREEVEWFNVVAYGRLAEICSQYLRKGRPVFIEGRIKTRNWIDAQGVKHYRTEVVAETMQMIGGKRDGNGGGDGDSHEEPVPSDEPSEPF
jgi:single-strand DNA-binding protein